MPAGHRDGGDRLLPQLVGELRQLLLGQLADVCGNSTVSSSGVSGRSDMAGGLSGSRRHVTNMPGDFQQFLRNCSANRSQSPHVPRTSITGRGAEKPGALRRLADAAGQAVVVDMHRLPALVADQEDAVVQAIRDARSRHRRWRFRPAGRGWRQRTGRGSGRRCSRRRAAPAPSRPPRRCHRRSPACRSSPALRTPPPACRSTARPRGQPLARRGLAAPRLRGA